MPDVRPEDLGVGDKFPPPWANEPSPVTVVCPRGECTHRANLAPEKVHVKEGDAEWYIVLDDRIDVHVCDGDCGGPGHRFANAYHAEVERQARQQGVSLASVELPEEG